MSTTFSNSPASDPRVGRRQSQERGLARRPVLVEAGAEVVYVVRSEARGESVRKLVRRRGGLRLRCRVRGPDRPACATSWPQRSDGLHGLVHSIAFADYDEAA